MELEEELIVRIQLMVQEVQEQQEEQEVEFQAYYLKYESLCSQMAQHQKIQPCLVKLIHTLCMELDYFGKAQFGNLQTNIHHRLCLD